MQLIKAQFYHKPMFLGEVNPNPSLSKNCLVGNSPYFRFMQRHYHAVSQILFRISFQEEEERKLQEQFEQRERTKLIQEEDRRKEREEHLRQRGGGRPKFYSKTDKQTQVRFPTQKDLRHQQKVLRDHGLVMGHVNDKFLS